MTASIIKLCYDSINHKTLLLLLPTQSRATDLALIMSARKAESAQRVFKRVEQNSATIQLKVMNVLKDNRIIQNTVWRPHYRIINDYNAFAVGCFRSASSLFLRSKRLRYTFMLLNVFSATSRHGNPGAQRLS